MSHVSHESDGRFPWCAFIRDADGNVTEVVLPSYDHVVYLSQVDERIVSPPACNRAEADLLQLLNEFRRLVRITKKPVRRSSTPRTDLVGAGRKREVCHA